MKSALSATLGIQLVLSTSNSIAMSILGIRLIISISPLSVCVCWGPKVTLDIQYGSGMDLIQIDEMNVMEENYLNKEVNLLL